MNKIGKMILGFALSQAIFWTSLAGAEPLVGKVLGVNLTVSDLDSSVAWYKDVLNCEVIGIREASGNAYEHLEGTFGARSRIATLKLGDETVELTDYLTGGGRTIPEDSKSNDAWFQHIAIVVSDMDKAYEVLRANDVIHASSGPQTLPDWNPNAGGIRAFYFKDPDHHVLEVIWFPEGKGNPRWKAPSDRLFLGIDHTAIVVHNTEESLAYYRDTLGMTVAGTSENWGVEQEHLNNIFGARLRITSLKGTEGPSIEFLEYLSPRTGSEYPRDTTGGDLWNWRTIISTEDMTSTAVATRDNGWGWISPGSVTLSEKTAAESLEGLSVRDPDGHCLVFFTSDK